MNGGDNLKAKSPLFVKVLEVAQKAAESSANVLITGETGTGKEVVANYIHSKSDRKNCSFVPLNCSAIPDQLLEAELFGFARGAFTGALNARTGLFEEAQGGTIFLDEIGDLDLHLQAKILRVLQEKKIKRVGENNYRPIDVRIVAATHNNLKKNVEEKLFRQDLYFRLNVVPIEIPALRKRPEDIVALSEFFLQKFSEKYRRAKPQLSLEALQILESYLWPGNVRELENAIERVVIFSKSSVIPANDLIFLNNHSDILPQDFRPFLKGGKLVPLQDIANAYIHFSLEFNGGAKDKTAKDLGIDRKTLNRRLQMET